MCYTLLKSKIRNDDNKNMIYKCQKHVNVSITNDFNA